MKEHDKIRDFISVNIDHFDVEIPSDKVWKGVAKSSKGSHWITSLSIAASILFVVTIGCYSLFLNQKDVSQSNDIVVNIELQSSNEAEEVENYYATQVNEKISQLEMFQDSEEMLEEVTNLKIEFDELKEDMGIGANRTIVLEAMIDNYRMRLLILEDLLQELDETKTDKEIDNEKHI